MPINTPNVPIASPFSQLTFCFIFLKCSSFRASLIYYLFNVGQLSMLVILPYEDTAIQQVQSNLEQFNIAMIKYRLAQVNMNFWSQSYRRNLLLKMVLNSFIVNKFNKIMNNDHISNVPLTVDYLFFDHNFFLLIQPVPKLSL